MESGVSGGACIGHYQMMGLLATGGMAEVYLALAGQLTGFRTPVVVKRILPHLASNADFIGMFFDEARIVALLDHPNIVRIIEVGQDGGEYFLAMEVVQGKPLSELMRQAVKRDIPLTQAQAAFLVAQAANGLGHAHDLVDAGGLPLNIVHRDVSPQNILVSYEGTVKVIDFGVARAMGRVSETRPGGLKGKVRYMAPEQAGFGRVDRRTDVFALGVVLWEAICGRRRFRRESDIAILRAIVKEPMPPPSRFVTISSRLESIVMKALERDPEKRFQTAQEMALALERFSFATQGFNPAQVGTTMKALFASDLARWKKTVAAVMNMQGEPKDWVNTGGTYLNPERIDFRTRAATEPLLKVFVPSGSTRPSEESASSSSLEPFPPPERAVPEHRRRRLALLFGIAASVTVVSAASGFGGFHWVMERTKQRSASASLLDALAVSGRAPAVSVSHIEPLAASRAPGTIANEPPHEAHADLGLTTASEVSAPITERRAPGERSGRTPRVSPPLQAASRQDHDKGRRATVTRAAAAKAALARAGVVKKTRVRAVGAPLGAGASRACSVVVGTAPWSEIWIDGKNTGRHTPATESVVCGAHKITFKRPDLGLARSFQIAVSPDRPFKHSFVIEDD